MRIREMLLICCIICFFSVFPAAAVEYLTITAEVLKASLAKSSKYELIDIQPTDEFREHNFKNSTGTGASPVKTAADRKKLDLVLKKIGRSKKDIVIVSTDGGEDATRSADYLAAAGIEKSRIIILKGGMESAMHGEGCDCCKVGGGHAQEKHASEKK